MWIVESVKGRYSFGCLQVIPAPPHLGENRNSNNARPHFRMAVHTAMIAEDAGPILDADDIVFVLLWGMKH